jgi:hypothetical protein
MRVPSTAGPSEVFEAVGVIGPVAEFSFTAPELSEVFITSVGRTNAPSGVDGPTSDADADTDLVEERAS